MKKDEALYSWFQQFSFPFYPSTELPEKPLFPYGTYEPKFGFYGDEVYPTVNIYDNTDSERRINAYADELAEAIGLSGTVVECDSGAFWIKRGSPFSQAINDPDNANIKRRLISIAIEYLTTD